MGQDALNGDFDAQPRPGREVVELVERDVSECLTSIGERRLRRMRQGAIQMRSDRISGSGRSRFSSRGPIS
jgi:hypothetical protein